jgi:hypothetical protein
MHFHDDGIALCKAHFFAKGGGDNQSSALHNPAMYNRLAHYLISAYFMIYPKTTYQPFITNMPDIAMRAL